jgi:hypothetical protein
MAFSRQFKALAKIGGFFAAAWGAVGTIVSMVAGGPLLPSLMTFGVMFGAAGGISGIVTALLVARGEADRAVREVPTWRAALWGILGGVAPAAGLAAIVAASSAPHAVVPLLVLGAVSGLVGGAITGGAVASAKRAERLEGAEQPRLGPGG